ncbi:Mob1/phocein [Aspergillus egyptiacus]|nr:Mob1/phocein [Aspergillus egyptiacus]
MTAAGVSPSSSPRLPSPPPLTEVQIGPKSPSIGESFGGDADLPPVVDDGSTRRIRPGSKASEMAAGPPLIPLSQLDSPFQLQEHLKALYNHYTRPEDSDTVIPITREVARQLAEPPEGVDRSLWLYELCRFLTMKVNNLIVAFFAENPPCSSQTCPEMRASEWQYLCAVHDPPKACCAIDYCCHTLDWATNILTSSKHFPSRLTLGSESGGGLQAGLRHLTNIFRRLYRIFAHAWFQHREVFWQVEGHDGLYMFFKTVCDMYHLIPEDNYTVPPEAEGDEAHPPQAQEQNGGRRLTILRKEDESLLPPLDQAESSSISTGATTRRHKSSPSIASRVTTINESAEDSEDPTELSSPETKEPKPQSQPASPADDSSSEPVISATQNDDSHVTVAEVDPEDEAPSAEDVASTADKPQESQPAQASEEESPASATEEVKSDADPKSEPQPEPEAEQPEPATQSESKSESKSEEKPEEKLEANPEPSEKGDEPAKDA